MKSHKAVLVLALIALFPGCGEGPPVQQMSLPPVNDDNCKTENVVKLPERVRQKFADACVRRGTFRPSSNYSW